MSVFQWTRNLTLMLGAVLLAQAAQAELAARLPRGAAHRFEGARHEILLELDRYRNAFWERFDAFTA